jgi:hypothetical protein
MAREANEKEIKMANKVHKQASRIHGLTLPIQDLERIRHAIKQGATMDELVLRAMSHNLRTKAEPPAHAVTAGEGKLVLHVRPGIIHALKQNPAHFQGTNVTPRFRSALRNLAATLPQTPGEIAEKHLKVKEAWLKAGEAESQKSVVAGSPSKGWRGGAAQWIGSRVRGKKPVAEGTPA